MNSPTLFDTQTQTLCHKSDPDTSREAAAKMVESGVLKTQEFAVMVHIIAHCYHNNKDFTARELSKAKKIDYHPCPASPKWTTPQGQNHKDGREAGWMQSLEINLNLGEISCHT